MIDPKLLRLAFYESSDGPRIMIFGPSESDFVSLQKSFRGLSNGKGTINLQNLPFVFVAGGVKICMQSTGEFFDKTAKTSTPGLRRVPKEDCSFVWTRTNEGWDYLAELIAGLIQSNSSGHQYLTSYPDEDAILVVSKGEYGDDVIPGFGG